MTVFALRIPRLSLKKKRQESQQQHLCDSCGRNLGGASPILNSGRRPSSDHINQAKFQEQSIFIKRVTGSASTDTRQRLNSVSSSLSFVQPPALASSSLLRRRSSLPRQGAHPVSDLQVDDIGESSHELDSAITKAVSRSKSAVDLGQRRPSALSRGNTAGPATVSVRKISVGGQEDCMSVCAPGAATSWPTCDLSTPVLIPSPPPKIDYSHPFGGSFGFVLENAPVFSPNTLKVDPYVIDPPKDVGESGRVQLMSRIVTPQSVLKPY